MNHENIHKRNVYLQSKSKLKLHILFLIHFTGIHKNNVYDLFDDAMYVG